MTEQEKLALLEETIEADEGALTPDMLLENVEEYDSLSKLSIIVMMDEEFGKKLTSDDFNGFKTVKDILDVMK